jgi:hypothetical protein
MQPKYDAQTFVASTIIQMLFKYLKPQIYLIIIFFRKINLKHHVTYIVLAMEFGCYSH